MIRADSAWITVAEPSGASFLGSDVVISDGCLLAREQPDALFVARPLGRVLMVGFTDPPRVT